MPDKNRPLLENWHHFSQSVQKKLIDPFRLQEGAISVVRHESQNKTVKVEVKLSSDHYDAENSSQTAILAPGAISPEPLSQNPLNESIRWVLDDLLKNCLVDYGGITFIVNRGRLKETEFLYSNRPDEPTDRHFGTN